MIHIPAVSTLHALERFLLPNACVACARPVDQPDPDALVCSRCRWRMKLLAGGCPRCGQPLPPIGPCRVCASWPPALRWARSAMWLGPEARAVVHQLKYGGLSRLATLAADMIARSVSRPSDALLLPIPLTAMRQRHRGYNQAATIARALGRRWSLPVTERVLRRHGQSTSQTRITAGARGTNVAGAFLAIAPPTGRENVPSAEARAAVAAIKVPAVIIVDDVFTTGATIASAAAALAEAGWPEIGAITLARAVPIELRLT